MEEVGNALLVARVDAGLTLREAAQASGVHKDMISRIERDLQHPTPLTVGKLARAYGRETADFLVGAEHPRSQGLWPPRLGVEEAAAQALSGTGWAKLQHWRDYIERFNRDRREELKTGRVRRAEGWTLTPGARKPTWQQAEEIKLDNAATREAWELVVRRDRARILDQLERFGVRAIASHLLSMEPEELSGEARENYRQAAGLSTAMWELDALVASLSDELTHLDDEIERRSNEQDKADEASELLQRELLEAMPQPA